MTPKPFGTPRAGGSLLSPPPAPPLSCSFKLCLLLWCSLLRALWFPIPAPPGALISPQLKSLSITPQSNLTCLSLPEKRESGKEQQLFGPRVAPRAHPELHKLRSVAMLQCSEQQLPRAWLLSMPALFVQAKCVTRSTKMSTLFVASRVFSQYLQPLPFQSLFFCIS